MRKFIDTIAAKLNPKSIVTFYAILLAVTIIPASVFAWGPGRPTYTLDNPADHVTFNSITDNPVQGDERNFMQVREQTASNETYADSINVAPGKKYVVFMYYHNNASSSLNAGGTGIAHGAYAKAEVPAVVKNGASTPAMGYVGAANAAPAQVYDDITFKNTSGADIAMRYVPGSTNIHNFGATNGAQMPDSILGSGGVKLGFDSLNGDLPGCNHYAGYITFVVQADQPNFTFTKQVRKMGAGPQAWAPSVNTKIGDKVDFLLSYKNTGTTEQDDVVMNDALPAGLTYVSGSSVLQNGNNPEGKTIADGVTNGKINVGDYAPGATGYVYLTAQVADQTLPSCNATLINTAGIETDNGNRQATANVVVTKEGCAPPVATETLPTTGPGEVVAAFIGIAAITIGLVYYFKSRHELEQALHNAQSQITTGKKPEGDHKA